MRLGHRRRRRLEHRGWQHTLGQVVEPLEVPPARCGFRFAAQNKYSSARFACDQFQPQP